MRGWVASAVVRTTSITVPKGNPARRPVSLATLAVDLKSIWSAPTTDARLKKRIVRTVIHEVAHHFGIEEDRLAELGWE